MLSKPRSGELAVPGRFPGQPHRVLGRIGGDQSRRPLTNKTNETWQGILFGFSGFFALERKRAAAGIYIQRADTPRGRPRASAIARFADTIAYPCAFARRFLESLDQPGCDARSSCPGRGLDELAQTAIRHWGSFREKGLESRAISLRPLKSEGLSATSCALSFTGSCLERLFVLTRPLSDQRFHNSCDGMRNARLNRDDAFSHEMIIVSSAIVSSS
jgi:hypothetical protein